MMVAFLMLNSVVAISNKAKGRPRVLLKSLTKKGYLTLRLKVNTPPRCLKYGRNYVGKCLRGINACFGCKKIGYNIVECLNIANKGKEGRPQGQMAQRGQVQQGSQAQGGSPRGNRFYALHARKEDEESPDMVTGMLRVFDS